jgi:hypothetical protein
VCDGKELHCDIQAGMRLFKGHSGMIVRVPRDAVLALPRMKRHAAREAACLDRSCPRLSAYVGDALLSICFGRARWLRWQLKHRCLLTFT